MNHYKKTDNCTDKVISWMYNSSNDFNKPCLEDNDSCNNYNIVSGNQLSNSSNASSDFISASQQFRSTPYARKDNLLSTYLHSTRKVYTSCVKPTRRQLRRRQLPNLFENSRKSKRKLSESIHNLYTFIDDVDVIDPKDKYTSKRACIESINHSDNIYLNYFPIDKEHNKLLVSVPESDPFSDTTSDTNWSENKSIDLKNVFVKNIRCNQTEKVRLKLKRRNRKPEQNHSEVNTNISENPTQISSKKYNNNKNLSKRRVYYNTCKENPIVNNEQISSNLQDNEIGKNKILLQQESFNKCGSNNNNRNNELESEKESKVSVNNNHNSNNESILNRKMDQIHASKLTKKSCISNKRITERLTSTLNNTILLSPLTDGECTNDHINTKKQNVNTCNNQIKSINCHHDKIQNKRSIIRDLVKKRIENKYVNKTVPKKSNLKARVNDKKHIGSIKIKSVLKSPGWSKLIDHMKELNIQDEYKCNKREKVAFRQGVIISGKNKQTRKLHEVSKSDRRVGNKKCVGAKDNKSKQVCFHSSQYNVVDNIRQNFKESNTGNSKKKVSQKISYKSNNYQINITNSLNNKEYFQPEVAVNIDKDCDSNKTDIFRNPSVSNNQDNQSPSVISNSQPTQGYYLSNVTHTNYKTFESSESIIETSIKLNESNYPYLSYLCESNLIGT